MLFIDSLRDLLWLDAPLSFVNGNLFGARSIGCSTQAIFTNGAMSDD